MSRTTETPLDLTLTQLTHTHEYTHSHTRSHTRSHTQIHTHTHTRSHAANTKPLNDVAPLPLCRLPRFLPVNGVDRLRWERGEGFCPGVREQQTGGSPVHPRSRLSSTCPPFWGTPAHTWASLVAAAAASKRTRTSILPSLCQHH